MKELIRRHRQKIDFLIVGGWNTLFGYAVFVLLYWLFSARVHYLLLLVAANVVSITNAYVGYKFFVFKTEGNYLREYLRFYVVYGLVFGINLILLPLFVEVLYLHPIAGQAIITVIGIIVSYIGHRNISFGGK